MKLLLVLFVLLLTISCTIMDWLNPFENDQLLDIGDSLSVCQLSDSNVRLSWESNAESGDSFLLQKKVGSQGEYSELVRLGSDVDYYIDDSLSTDYVYYYLLTGYRDSESTYSIGNSIQTVFAPIDTLIISQINLTTASLYWQHNCSYETGYIIERRSLDDTTTIKTSINTQRSEINKKSLKVSSDIKNKDSFQTFVETNSSSNDFHVIATFPPNIFSFIDDTLEENYNYEYRIKAISDFNESDYRSTIYNNNPPNPTNFNYEVLSENSIELSWDEFSYGGFSFVIDKKIDEIWQNNYATIPSTQTSWEDNLNEPNKYFTFRIRSENEGIYSEYTYTDTNAVVMFEDVILEQVVRDELEIWNSLLLHSDLELCEILHAGNFDIQSLYGLEFMVNVFSLDLCNNNVSDLTPLQNLTKLITLKLYDNNISNVTPLQNLTNLNRLDIDHNNITDISPLHNLINLTRFYSGSNNISDISVLQNFVNLESTTLYFNNISDISPLQNLFEIWTLNLKYNDIHDITPLQNLTRLNYLTMDENSINDITALQNLTRIKRLRLTNNNISDITPLQNMSILNELYLENNNISDITPLQNLDDLIKLYLTNNNISDLNPLQDLTNLESLLLQGNNINDIEPVENLSNLVSLYISNNNVSDMTPIQNLSMLEWLRFDNNSFNDITPLENLNNLSNLYFSNNLIIDILPLVNNSGIGEGDYLDLQDNPLSHTTINVYIPMLQERGVDVDY